MLSKKQALSSFSKKGELLPDRLTRAAHGNYVELAESMFALYSNGKGRRRKDLEQAVANIFSDTEDCPPRRIAAFQKLLYEKTEFERSRRSQTLRLKVYRIAAKHHPVRFTASDALFGEPVEEVRSIIEKELGLSWEEIEDAFFADVEHFQKLKEFKGYEDAGALLSRYNVAQTQAALYSATKIEVIVEQDFKAVLRQAKLSRLMHTIERYKSGYKITFDGPASVLVETTRYGAAMARFLPSLLACKNWSLRATIKVKGGGKVFLNLSPTNRLSSPVEPDSAYDSSVEATFAEKWGNRPRDGWTLHREDIILDRAQKTFIPDFVFRHETGREVYFEIAGFWTPEYWQRKQETLKAFSDEPLLLAIPKAHVSKLPECAFPIIHYKTAITLKHALEALSDILESRTP